VGAAGLALIKQFEGCRLTAYKPFSTERYWTIGWGHYGPDVREGQSITQAEADALLERDCQRFADAVDNPAYCPVTNRLNGNQRDALISFAFNCGAGCLRTLCANRGLTQIAAALLLYNKGGGGKVLPGLVRRRTAEKALFETPMKEEPVMDNTPRISQEAVDWARSNGILRGNGGDLMLSSPCTREQVIVFLWRYHRTFSCEI